jgi:hypothetical protein
VVLLRGTLQATLKPLATATFPDSALTRPRLVFRVCVQWAIKLGDGIPAPIAKKSRHAQDSNTTTTNMHELKPLMLPKLVAARKSSQTSLNMSSETNSGIFSSADSGFYSASECSTPPTPSMHSRGHFRFPSSTSSLSSSPPTHEAIEPPNSSGKLPKLTEEPVEREYDYGNEDPYRCSCKSQHIVYGSAHINKQQVMSSLSVTPGIAWCPKHMTLSMIISQLMNRSYG